MVILKKVNTLPLFFVDTCLVFLGTNINTGQMRANPQAKLPHIWWSGEFFKPKESKDPWNKNSKRKKRNF